MENIIDLSIMSIIKQQKLLKQVIITKELNINRNIQVFQLVMLFLY